MREIHHSTQAALMSHTSIKFRGQPEAALDLCAICLQYPGRIEYSEFSSVIFLKKLTSLIILARSWLELARAFH